MTDKRISDLARINAADLEPAVDFLALADLSAAETKKVTPRDLVDQALTGVTAGTIPGSAITDGSITGAKLGVDSVTAREIAASAVNTAEIADGAVTNDKLAGGIAGSKLANGAVGSTQLAAGAVNGGTHILDRSIPAVKIQLNALTADEIAPNAIGASELADNAVDTSAVQDNALTTPKYQDLSVTSAKLANGIDGAKLTDGSVAASKLAGGISGGQIANVLLSTLPNASAGTVLAGPVTGAAASPSYRALVSSDLPEGTATVKGVLSVPTTGGLKVTGGALSIDNSITAGSHAFITFDSHGLVTGGRALVGTDLPAPVGGSLGAVKAGTGITIVADGTLSQSVTGVAAGTYTKVTTDVQGNITAGAALQASDIPALSAAKITTGQFGDAFIADGAITRRHLADYAIAYIQEATPPTTGVPIGELWFQESTAGLHMWNGNSWMPISIGRLSQENLRYCGTVDATNGLITGVTTFGTSAGYKIGDALKAATDAHTGVYFVITTPGNAIPEAPGITFDNGDWILCNGSAAGWIRVDTLNGGGGGGGGGATHLNDLLDVTLTTPVQDSLLQYSAAGQWVNVVALDEGFF